MYIVLFVFKILKRKSNSEIRRKINVQLAEADSNKIKYLTSFVFSWYQKKSIKIVSVAHGNDEAWAGRGYTTEIRDPDELNFRVYRLLIHAY